MNPHQQDLFPVAERIYLRMQAQDVLRRCLEEHSTDPMREMFEQLLAGDPDIDLLQELLGDIKSHYRMLRERRFESRERVMTVFREGYELEIDEFASRVEYADYARLTTDGLLDYLQNQAADLNDEDALLLGQVFEESTGLVARLSSQIRIVEHLMEYLGDWLMALSVEAVRDAPRAFEEPHAGWVQ